jgi:hypothetical protein
MLYEPNPGGHQILIGTNAQGPQSQIELRKEEGLIGTRTQNSVQAAGFDLSCRSVQPSQSSLVRATPIL